MEQGGGERVTGVCHMTPPPGKLNNLIIKIQNSGPLGEFSQKAWTPPRDFGKTYEPLRISVKDITKISLSSVRLLKYFFSRRTQGIRRKYLAFKF